MKKLYFLLIIFFITSLSFGQVINEFEPNANGADPDPASIELKGTPSDPFTGWFLSVESDPGTSNPGLVDRATLVSGSFDGNGLLVVSVPDLENPSFTVVLVSDFTGEIGVTDLDANDDGTADDLSSLGTVYDAIGVPDTSGDEVTLYGAQLGGSDFTYTGDEPRLVFRDGVTGDLYAINDNGGTPTDPIFDLSATEVFAVDFDVNPAAANTFGTGNPVYTPPVDPTLTVIDGPPNGGSINLPSFEASGDITFATTNFDVDTDPNGDGYINFTVTDDDTFEVINDEDVYDTSTPSNYGPLVSGHTYSFVAELLNYNGSSLIPAVVYDITVTVLFPPSNAMVIAGVFDVQNNSTPKGMELYVLEDIPDLSVFGVGSANNGGGTDGQEFTFPVVSANQGDYIYIVGSGQLADFNTFFGNSITAYESGAMFINGDDAIELFENGEVIDVFGTIDCDPNAGSSTCPEWEHTDGWAYRVDNTGPDGSTFVLGNWIFSGITTLDGVTNGVSTNPYPIGTYMNTLSTSQFEVNSFKLFPNPNTTGELNIISSNNGALKAEIFDVLGKRVLSSQVNNNSVNISSLNSGLYIVRITQDNISITKKLVIE